MGIISWMFFGLLVGAIAKWLTPGRDPAGTVLTVTLGVAGSLLGGFIGRGLGMYPDTHGVYAAGFAMSVVGAMALLTVNRAVLSCAR